MGTPPASLLGSLALAAAVLTLVLGRDDVPTVTYLVYTSDPQPLPRGGLVETPSGEHIRLRFEAVGDGAEVAMRLTDARGLVLDSTKYAALGRDLLREWRLGGTVLVVYGIDAAQVAVELEVEPRQAPRPGAPNQFMVIQSIPKNTVIGDPASLDRTQPFIGVTYRPPAEGGDVDFGRLGWFTPGEERLGPWLAEWARLSDREYAATK